MEKSQPYSSLSLFGAGSPCVSTYGSDGDSGCPGEADSEDALLPLWVRLLALAAIVPDSPRRIGICAELAVFTGVFLVESETGPLACGPLILAQLNGSSNTAHQCALSQ